MQAKKVKFKKSSEESIKLKRNERKGEIQKEAVKKDE